MKITSFIRHIKDKLPFNLKRVPYIPLNRDGFSLENIWDIREVFDGVDINDTRYQFFELQGDDALTNGYEYLFNEFASVYIFMSIIKADGVFAKKLLQRAIDKLYEQNFESQRRGIIDTTFLGNDLAKAKTRMQLFYERKQAFLVKTSVALAHRQNYHALSLFGSLFNIEVTPKYFNQLQELKAFFLSDTAEQEKHLSLQLESLNPLSIITDTRFNGIYIGHQVGTNIPIFEDIFSYENYISVIMAKSGAGKSFLAKMLIKRLIFQGVKVITFDPEGEYVDFCKSVGGVTISSERLEMVDRYMREEENIGYIKDMFPLLFSNQSDLSMVREYFWDVESFGQFKVKLKALPIALRRTLQMYVDLHSKETIPDTHFMNVHIQVDELRVPLYKLISYCLSRKGDKTMLVIDEAHKVMDDEHVAALLRKVAKRGRKYNLGICVISQDIVDFVQNKWSKAIISNASMKFLLRQEPIHMPLISKIFEVGEYADFLTTAKKGEGLVLCNNTIRKVHFDPL
jgi:hypothetical protein